MNETRVAVLTPPGGSAIAVLAVRGPAAWPALQRLFRTAAGRALSAPPSGFVFGRLGEQSADEVILSATGPDSFEIHCHGGPRVVEWLLGLLERHGISGSAECAADSWSPEAARLLSFARTVRTAGILLDQVHGAYDRAEAVIRTSGPEANVVREVLRRNALVGRHLVEPWVVGIAGAPNAGKSSLLNALAGFARSIVSPTPGTTRDAVSVSLAFDGWPVSLVDTAGLRNAPDTLEAEGVERARAALAASDLVVWVVDVTGPSPASVQDVANELGLSSDRLLIALNKTDLAAGAMDQLTEAVRVSAVNGAGLTELIERITAALVPEPPRAGEPVPFTPELSERWSRS